MCINEANTYLLTYGTLLSVSRKAFVALALSPISQIVSRQRKIKGRRRIGAGNSCECLHVSACAEC